MQKPCMVLNQTNIDTYKSEIKMFQKSSVCPRRMLKPNAILFPRYPLDYESPHTQREKTNEQKPLK